MNGNHYRIECSCGAIIEQCRCPSAEKRVEVRASACPKCRAASLPTGRTPIVAVSRDSLRERYSTTAASGPLLVERLRP